MKFRRKASDPAVDEPRFLQVGLAVVRQELVQGDLLGQVDRRGEGFAAVFGEARAAAEILDVQHLVQQEIQMAAINQLARIHGRSMR